MKKLRITVDGKVYEVSVEILDEGGGAPSLGSPGPSPIAASSVGISAPLTAPRASVASADGDVPSPLSGKVVAVDVQVGASVKEGDQIMTLEAMKMNTYVYAPKSGKVLAVLVSPGDGVEEGQALVRIG